MMNERKARFKVRNSGNTDVIAMPQDVKAALGIESGDYIEFVIDGQNNVSLHKVPRAKSTEHSGNESSADYRDLMEDIVDTNKR